MKCPGQDTQYWQPGAIFEVECPQCREKVEFFKDDTSRKCGRCGHRFVNPKMDFGCAAYCQYAEQCLGTLPEELTEQRDDLLKDRVAVEMKRRLQGDFQRIGIGMRTARYAERIAKREFADLPVVLCAAYLKNLGTAEARRKNPEVSDAQIAAESREIARSVLAGLGAGEELIAAVCEVLQPGRASSGERINAQIVADAERIAALEESRKTGTLSDETLERVIAENMFTESGRQEARNTLLP